jgi:hypothetical protein
VSSDLLLKIADGDVERAASEHIRRGIVVARLGKLPVGVGAGEIRKAHCSSNYNKPENNDKRSALRCSITRTEELFHRVKTFMRLERLRFEKK